MKVGFAGVVGRILARLILPELRLIRKSCEGIQAALEYRNAQEWGQTMQADPNQPAVEISYVNDEQQATLMDIELRLTAASGAPPTEDEILAEYERRFGPEGGTPA